MPLDTLEEVRLLSNLETHRHKLMQIVLFGQPELDRKLELKSIRQLRERITHSFQLEPLKVGEISEYLRFRLQSAGCPWPQLFHPRAAALLARASGGLSRRINILADKSLLAAYADPATRPQPRNGAGEVQSMVLPRHVRTAIADSAYKSMGSYRQGKGRLTPWLGYSAAAALGALLLWGGLWLQGSDERRAAVAGRVSINPASELSQSDAKTATIGSTTENLGTASLEKSVPEYAE